jgi:hypothetical protein
MRRAVSAFGMMFWVGILALAAWWVVCTGWWLMGHHWELSGLAMCLAGLLMMGVAANGILLVISVLCGRTTARLAKRDFRNSMANLIMFARTGLWKE